MGDNETDGSELYKRTEKTFSDISEMISNPTK